MMREEAIEIINRENDPNDTKVWEVFPEYREALDMAIQALEQNERAEEWYKLFVKKLDEQEPCDDAISRQAYADWLDWLCRLRSEINSGMDMARVPQGHRDKYIDVLTEVIDNLPSVTQKSETVTEFADRCRECGAKYGKYRKEAKRWKNKWLKSQKSGKWIKVKSGDKDFPESIVCSRCNNENSHLDFNENAEPIGKVFITSKFCPNCGCHMVEPQEGSE